jgi:hypothetical protein
MLRDLEKKLGENYMELEDTVGMPLQDFITLVEQGMAFCEDTCDSRELNGQVACRCVRGVFPHPDYFILYEKLREIRFSQEFAAFLRKLSEE